MRSFMLLKNLASENLKELVMSIRINSYRTEKIADGERGHATNIEVYVLRWITSIKSLSLCKTKFGVSLTDSPDLYRLRVTIQQQ
jgi:hypothetical protein